MRNIGNAAEYFMFFKWKSKTLVCLWIFYKHFWVKNKDIILFTNHFYLGWKEIRLRLTEIPWAVELSGKTAMISTKLRIRRIVRITSHDISYNRGNTNGFHESYALFFAKV